MNYFVVGPEVSTHTNTHTPHGAICGCGLSDFVREFWIEFLFKLQVDVTLDKSSVSLSVVPLEKLETINNLDYYEG